MPLPFLARLFRRSARPPEPNPPLLPTPPPSNALFLADIGSDNSPVTVKHESNLLDTLIAVLPELADVEPSAEGTMTMPLPQGLNVDTLATKLKDTRAFEWKREGETVERDMLHTHNLYYKPTLSGAWKTKPQVLRSRVVRGRPQTMKNVSNWLETFVSGDKTGLWPSVGPSVDPNAIWEQLAFVADAALFKHDLTTVPDSPVSPVQVEPAPDHSLLNVLGVLKGEDSNGPSLKIYSVEVSGYAHYDPKLRRLRSTIKGVLRSVRYLDPSSPDP